MAGDGLVPWLRAEITADLDAARLISAGGFEPQRWDTEPPGQLNPAVMPLPFRDAVNAALIPDEEDRAFREDLPHWVQVVAYDRMLGEPPEADCRDSDLPVMLVDDGRREVEHVIRHDPRNAAADCEAKLSVLDLCERVIGEDEHAHEDCGAAGSWTGLAVARLAVRRMAYGYRHRKGYREAEWKP